MKKLLLSLVVLATILTSCNHSKSNASADSPSESSLNMNNIPVMSHGQWGFISPKGDITINLQFEEADYFSNGLALAKKDGRYGYIDANGTFVIQPEYSSATRFSEGLAFVSSPTQRLKCINTKGETVFELNDETIEICTFSEGVAFFVNKEDLLGCINTKGEIVIQPQYKEVYPFFQEGLAAVRIGKKWGYINHTGQIVINPLFAEAKPFSDGLAVVSDGHSYGYINTSGQYVIEPQYKHATQFSNGLACVGDNQFGFINSKGDFIITPQFDNAAKESGNSRLRAVSIGNDWGYVNKNGKYVINPQFEDANAFINDKWAIVMNNNKYGIIDTNGKYIVPLQYDDILVYQKNSNKSYAQNDYYDVSELVNAIIEKIGDNTVENLDASSTIQTIIEHPIYGQDTYYVISSDEYEEIFDTQEEYLKHALNKYYCQGDIEISEVRLHFEDDIFTLNWMGEKELNRNAKLKGIDYNLLLHGNARNREKMIISQLNAAICKHLNIKESTNIYNDDNFYESPCRDGKMGFIVSAYKESEADGMVGFRFR